jgi:hypothetical protein
MLSLRRSPAMLAGRSLYVCRSLWRVTAGCAAQWCQVPIGGNVRHAPLPYRPNNHNTTPGGGRCQMIREKSL